MSYRLTQEEIESRIKEHERKISDLKMSPRKNKEPFDYQKHVEMANKLSASFKEWGEGQAYEKEKEKLDEAFASASASMSAAQQVVNKCYTDGLVYKKR